MADEVQDMRQALRRNIEMGHMIYEARGQPIVTVSDKVKLEQETWLYPEETRKKALELVNNSLDMLIALNKHGV